MDRDERIIYINYSALLIKNIMLDTNIFPKSGIYLPTLGRQRDVIITLTEIASFRSTSENPLVLENNEDNRFITNTIFKILNLGLGEDSLDDVIEHEIKQWLLTVLHDEISD